MRSSRRYCLYAALGILPTVLPRFSQQARTPIFRYINIEPCGRLDLDSTFSPRGRAVVQNDSTFRLIPRCFGGAEQLLVHVSGAHHITAFEFAYGSAQSLASYVLDYERSIGPPSRVDTTAGTTHVVVWEDARTEFTLFRRIRSGRADSFARLSNRQAKRARP